MKCYYNKCFILVGSPLGVWKTGGKRCNYSRKPKLWKFEQTSLNKTKTKPEMYICKNQFKNDGSLKNSSTFENIILIHNYNLKKYVTIKSSSFH